MTEKEWSQLATLVNQDIRGLTRACKNQARIRKALKHRRANPTEEYFIDEAAFGKAPTEPSTFVVAGIEIKVWKIHRAGLLCRDIEGADLYYEIPNRAYLLLQYKMPTAAGRVIADDEQLLELQNACPVKCPPPDRFNCGAWYCIRTTSVSSYFPGCEAKSLFKSQKSRDIKYFKAV